MSVSKPMPHDAAHLHVTGQARYIDDIPTPSVTLHLAFGLSEIACGRITTMTLDAVKDAPGVIAVLTADDLPFIIAEVLESKDFHYIELLNCSVTFASDTVGS